MLVNKALEFQIQDKERMDSSLDFKLSNDWDIINSSTEENIDCIEEPSGGVSTNDQMIDVVEKGKELKGTGVHDIPELESNHNESSSSSEFDVIDETADDNHSNLSISHMEFSLSSSSERNQRPPVVPDDIAEPESEAHQPANLGISIFDRFRLYPHLVQRIIIVISMFVVILGICFSASDSVQGTIYYMKGHMSALQAENIELKNQMRSRFENNKMLVALEEQIKVLKDENYKLSSSMQALVLQLDKQTAILRNDKETKMQDSYRSEIKKLKEDIKALQAQNGALHSELSRLGFGLPHFPMTRKERVHFLREYGKSKNLPPSEFENISEEESFYRFQEVMMMQLSKIEDLNKSIKIKLGIGNDGSHIVDEFQYLKNENRQSKRESIQKISEEKDEIPPKKEKKPEWSWNVLRKNIMGTLNDLPNINVSDMLSKYVDKKKVEDAFESVGHYFKKAQKKTRKILNYNDDGKDYFWNILGDLRKKWSDLKDDFFEKNYENKEDYKPQFSTDIPPQPQNFVVEKKIKKQENQHIPGEKPKMKKFYQNIRHPDSGFPSFSETRDWKRRDRKLKRNEKTDDSWMLLRAAQRSQLRMKETKDAFINWHLRNMKDEDIDAMTQESKDAVINWFLKRNKNDEDIDVVSQAEKDAVINWFLKRNKNDEEIDAMTEADKDAVINWYLKRNKNEEEIEAMTEADKDAVINWYLKRNKNHEDTDIQEWMTSWKKYKYPSNEE
ncbi:uncharacterized protein NPIL_532391 [Nephila pilipes]|uniref:Uncharacterized protein n=1 Tax=Nephila pilipes TaxID=299642 RepID=A0A8X6QCL3_NEPPI|nr:uncharacterized protein NPIL_532391 [Nephila pilipes]